MDTLGIILLLQVILIHTLIIDLLLLEDKCLDLLDCQLIKSLLGVDTVLSELLLQLGVEALHLDFVSIADLGLDQLQKLLLQLVPLRLAQFLEGKGLLKKSLLLGLLGIEGNLVSIGSLSGGEHGFLTAFFI